MAGESGEEEEITFSELAEEYGSDSEPSAETQRFSDNQNSPEETAWERATASKEVGDSEDYEDTDRLWFSFDTDRLANQYDDSFHRDIELFSNWSYDIFQTVERRQESTADDLKAYTGNLGVLEIRENSSGDKAILYEPSAGARPANEQVHGFIYSAVDRLLEKNSEIYSSGIKTDDLDEEDMQEILTIYTAIDESLDS